MSNSATKYNVVNNLKNCSLSNTLQILFLKGIEILKKIQLLFLTEEVIAEKNIPNPQNQKLHW